MLDALLALVDIAEAHPGAMPMLDGQPPQVIVIVPAERLPRRPLADPRPRPLTGGWIGAESDHARSARSGSARPSADHPPSAAPPGARAGSLVPPALATVAGESTPVDDATARWAACGHAEIRRLVLAPDGVVTDLGRTARVAGRDLRLRVALRDRWCRHPGCRVPALRCQAHHLVHWADGGATSLPNLFALCHRHHRLHHQWQAAGQLIVTGTPDGDLGFFNGAVHLGTTRPQPVHRLPRPDPPTEAGPDTRLGGG